jgi:hypothetical protein
VPFIPPDHSKGDEHTLGGYIAVHARPPAFQGSDGMSYSVSIETDETGDAGGEPWGAYLFFVRWSYGDPKVSGHLESDFLARGESESAARARLGELPLEEVKRTLDTLLRDRLSAPARPWWEAMRDDDGGGAGA